MASIGIPFLELLHTVIHLYIWVVIIYVVINLLISFNVVNPYNKLVLFIQDFTTRATEPLLNPLRRVLPSFNGIDLAPLVLILALYFIEAVIRNLVVRMIL